MFYVYNTGTCIQLGISLHIIQCSTSVQLLYTTLESQTAWTTVLISIAQRELQHQHEDLSKAKHENHIY